MCRVHVPDVLATGFFTKAHWFRVLDPPPPMGRVSYQIHYESPSVECYRRYVETKAPALQKDHTDRYAGRFSASRALLDTQLERRS